MDASAISAQWDSALRDFATAQRATKYDDKTIYRRTMHMRRFAESRGDLLPWAVTFEDLAGWLDSLPLGRDARMQYRQSTRAFYGWANRTGRMLTNPSDEPSRRAKRLPVPPAWEEPLNAYGRYLWSIGQPQTTVSVRQSQLRRMARELGCDPLEATFDHLVEWSLTRFSGHLG